MKQTRFSRHDKVVRMNIVNELRARHGISKAEAEKIVDTEVNYIRAELAAGHDVEIRGLGSLVVKTRGPRPARDIKEGTAVIIPRRKAIVFRPGTYLKSIYKPGAVEKNTD